MMPRYRAWLFRLVAVCALALVASPIPCLEDDELPGLEAAITENFERGAGLFDDGAYAEAYAEFGKNFPYLDDIRSLGYSQRERLQDNGVYYSYADSWLYGGRSKLRLGEVDAAIRCLDVVRELVPTWDPIWTELSELHEGRGDRAAVMALWEACIEAVATVDYSSNKEYAWVPAKAYDRLSMLAIGDRDWTKAIAYGRAARGIRDPERVLPLMNAGLAALLAGDDATAIGFYATAMADADDMTKELLRQGIHDIVAYIAPVTDGATSAAGPAARFALWALADRLGDSVRSAAFLAAAAADPALPDRLDAIGASGGLEPAAHWATARFFASTGDADRAIAALGRATGGSAMLARQAAAGEPALAALVGTRVFESAFPRAAAAGAAGPGGSADRQVPRPDERPYEIVVQSRHRKAITGMEASPDGRFVATSSGDRTVRLWTKDGTLVRIYRSDRGLSCLAFSPDGSFLVAGTEAGALRLWKADGTPLPEIPVPSYPVHCVAVSPDGTRIAVTSSIIGSGDDFAVRLYDRSGAFLKAYQGHRLPVQKLAFGTDGRHLASLDLRGGFRVWDTVTGACVRSVGGTGSADDPVTGSFAFDPAGGGVWTSGAADGLVLSKPDGSAVRSLPVDTAAVPPGKAGRQDLSPYDLVPSPDGTTIALVVRDRAVTISARDGRALAAVEAGPGVAIGAARWTKDGGLLLEEATGGDDGSVRVVSVDAGGRRAASFPLDAGQLVHADVSPDGSRIAAVYDDRKIRLFRTDGSFALAFKELEGGFQSVRWSPDGTTLVASDDGNAKLGKLNVNASIWSPDGSLRKLFGYWYGVSANVATLESGYSRSRDAVIVPGSGNVILYGADAVVAYDQGGRKLRQYPFDAWDLDASADGTRVAFVGRDVAELWDGNGPVRRFPRDGDDYPQKVALSPDGSLVAFGYGSDLRLYAATGELLWSVAAHGQWIEDIAFSPDGRRVATCAGDVSIRIWNLDGTPATVLAGHRDSVRGLKYFRGSSRLFSYSDDGTMGLWNLETGESCFIAIEGDEWIIFTQDGYFDCSKKGGSLVAVVRGDDAYAVDQFALAWNRPDLILQRLGLGEEGQAGHYRVQYLRRIAKLGLLPRRIPIRDFEDGVLSERTPPEARKLAGQYWSRRGDAYVLSGSPGYAERLELMRSPDFVAQVEILLASGFDVPQARLLGSERTGDAVTLSLAFSSASSELYRWNAYVNGVPMYGSSGREIAGKEAQVRVTVPLSVGTNLIEAGCLNENLMESWRVRTVEERAGTARGDLYFIGSGVSAYRNPELNLGFAKKDVLDLAASLGAMEGSAFDEVHILALTDADATVTGLSAAASFLADATVDDTVVLFISGHGVHDDDPGATYYYLTHETDLGDLSRTAAPFELVEDILVGIAPRRKLFLIDTCESGDIEPGALDDAIGQAGLKGMAARTTRSGGLTLASRKVKSPPRSYLSQRDRYIYNDLTRRSGAIVFSSCGGGELSYELAEFENGLFTEMLMGALGSGGKAADADGDGLVAMNELEAFVSLAVAKASGGLQHPTVDRDNPEQTIAFPVSSRSRVESAPRASVMVSVEGSLFTMGSNRGRKDEYPEHLVRLDDYFLSAYELTVGEFAAFAADSGYRTERERENEQFKEKAFAWNSGVFAEDPDLPAIGISHTDAARYCNWASRRDGLEECYIFDETGVATCDFSKDGYRLPTEAEWEYAARGGRDDPGAIFAGGDRLQDLGWYSGNSGYRSHPVGGLAPNGLGLYDLSGNALELCEDWYAEDAYANAPGHNPRGPGTGREHVIRGGCWAADEGYAQVRIRQEPSYWRMQPVIGFRLARNAPEGGGR
ncbi:MAG: SUMF1/EgtB/PvdO family nonheme iron enzyme [Spirochaetes bacterium]|nr:SUMF1/EgtB/PvdO family nonheme iron enzyme [Spirochaetota bacterium]